MLFCTVESRVFELAPAVLSYSSRVAESLLVFSGVCVAIGVGCLAAAATDTKPVREGPHHRSATFTSNAHVLASCLLYARHRLSIPSPVDLVATIKLETTLGSRPSLPSGTMSANK